MKIYFGYLVVEDIRRKPISSLTRFSRPFASDFCPAYKSKVAVFIPSSIEKAEKSFDILRDGDWKIPEELPKNYKAVILPDTYLLTGDFKLEAEEKERIIGRILKDYITFEFW